MKNFATVTGKWERAVSGTWHDGVLPGAYCRKTRATVSCLSFVALLTIPLRDNLRILSLSAQFPGCVNWRKLTQEW